MAQIQYKNKKYEIERNESGVITQISEIKYNDTLLYLTYASIALLILVFGYDWIKDWFDFRKGVRKVGRSETKGGLLYIFGLNAGNLKRSAGIFALLLLTVILYGLYDKSKTQIRLDGTMVESLSTAPEFKR